jgi:outer membrane biosynthesis protein TonB
MMTSLAIHIVVMLLMLLVASQTVLRSAPPEKPVDIVFYRPPEIEIPVPAVKLAMPRTAYPDAAGVGAPAPAAHPKANAPAGPDGPGKPDLPSGPEEGYRTETPPQPAQPKVGNTGILAFKDKIASLAQDKIAPRLGADARYGAVDEVGQPSSRSTLMTNSPGSSGGINMASLNHSVGGGGMPVTRATSSINTIGGGDRPLSRGGAGPSRTDEEIQIVFDKYKSSFYRLYNRELRNDPTLKGQMVLRLTIEPDGSVSMCVLQSSDMKAPDLATQVVSRVKTINFGAKEGVPALTIVYPIDFLPAA